MKHRLLISVASAALIGINGLALAQAPSPSGATNAPAAAPSAPQSAPADKMAPAGRADSAQSQGAPGTGMKGAPNERATDNMRDGSKLKGANSDMDSKTGGKNATDKALGNKADKASDGMKGDAKSASDAKSSDGKSATTGQAGANAKLTTEQRTTIRTSITKQNVKPVTNVNFSISIGTRVPRTVSFYPLPAEVITVYPTWRGYEFFLVGNEIVVVNPRTLEIVAVLEA